MLAAMVVAPLICTVAGCSTGSGDSGHSSGPSGSSSSSVKSESGAAAAPQDLVLPIDAYGMTLAQSNALVRATSILVGDCMRKEGFQVDSAKNDRQMQALARRTVQDKGVNGNLRRYGVTDLGIARKYGNHLISAVDNPQKAPVSKKSADMYGLGPLTPAMSVALFGNSPQRTAVDPSKADPSQVGPSQAGCLDNAHKVIQGDSGSLGKSEVAAQIRGRSYVLSLTDPTVTAAFRRWAACMKAKGYTRATTPSDSVLDHDDVAGPTVSKQDIAVAEADVSCKQQNHVLRIWSGFEIKYQKDQIEKHSQELQQEKAALQAQVKRITDVLAKG
jgi:hypothetical protein